MPANKKYLAQSGWTKFSKIIAAIIGGLLASLTTHMAAAVWLPKEYVFPTSLYSIYIYWVLFMIIVYWIHKPWKSWIVVLLVNLISILCIYLGKN